MLRLVVLAPRSSMDPRGSTAAVPLLLFALLVPLSEAGFPEAFSEKSAMVPGAKDLGPWASGPLKFIPAASGPAVMAPEARFQLVLAARRTRRPDVLKSFQLYEGGWNITNKHYWASVAFAGSAGFVLAAVWLVSFAIALCARNCCKWRMGKERASLREEQTCVVFLLIFTCAASVGCVLLSFGQNKFHDETLNTLNFVANQSDFTVQILQNVSDYLSFARTISVAAVYLPSNVQKQIDKLKGDLTHSAGLLSIKTNENYKIAREAISDVRCTLIMVAALMLVLAVLGFVLSIFENRHANYIFILAGWLLVTVTFLLFGIFVIINSAAEDTCTAMDEWVRYPQAETALSNILPCVNERTTNQTLYQSKEVVWLLVEIVNTVISSTANREAAAHHKPIGSPMPYLCSPYDSQLRDRQCKHHEVSFANASMAWQNHICTASSSGSCVGAGQIAAETYGQLVLAANASYALYHYTPLLLHLQDCKFVRDTFSSLTTHYCPRLEHDLRLVSGGLVLLAFGISLYLSLWILFANRPQQEEFAFPSRAKIAPVETSA